MAFAPTVMGMVGTSCAAVGSDVEVAELLGAHQRSCVFSEVGASCTRGHNGTRKPREKSARLTQRLREHGACGHAVYGGCVVCVRAVLT